MVQIPSFINHVIFATLFIGNKLPKLNDIWNVAGPHVSYGQSVAWGQYVFGLLLALLILAPFFGLNPIAGASIEIGFEGGHGTAVGLQDIFDE